MILLQANQIARLFGAEVLFENIQLEIASNSRIALVGRNGAGKSTLLKIIAGLESPDKGTIAKNKTATMGYLAQDTGLASQATVWEEMLGAFATVRQMEQRMRTLEIAISEADPAADSGNLLKEYDQLQHEFAEKTAMAMKMRFAPSCTVFSLILLFTRKPSIPFLVVKKPAWH